jgi:hypothetical protein
MPKPQVASPGGSSTYCWSQGATRSKLDYAGTWQCCLAQAHTDITLRSHGHGLVGDGWCETWTWGGVSKHAGCRPPLQTCSTVIMMYVSIASAPGACALRFSSTLTLTTLRSHGRYQRPYEGSTTAQAGRPDSYSFNRCTLLGFCSNDAANEAYKCTGRWRDGKQGRRNQQQFCMTTCTAEPPSPLQTGRHVAQRDHVTVLSRQCTWPQPSQQQQQ